MNALDKLIEAVEVGNARHLDFVDAFSGYTMLDNVSNAYHGSLDAAHDLHVALLPEWGWDVTGEGASAVFGGGVISGPCEMASSETTARAWLLAILRAYRAQQGQS